MADRQFTCPVPRKDQVPKSMLQATLTLERVALKWRALAERRRAHFVELYKTGRWKHYYTDEEFRAELRAAIAMAERWAKIAPRPEELKQPSAENKAPVKLRVLRPAA